MTCVLCNDQLSNKISIVNIFRIKLGEKVYTDSGDTFSIHNAFGVFFALYYYTVFPFLMVIGVIFYFSLTVTDFLVGTFFSGWIISMISIFMAAVIYLLVEYVVALIVPLKEV